jgi:hypothetical protein
LRFGVCGLGCRLFDHISYLLLDSYTLPVPLFGLSLSSGSLSENEEVIAVNITVPTSISLVMRIIQILAHQLQTNYPSHKTDIKKENKQNKQNHFNPHKP